MKKIVMFDTSYSTQNMGDFIINKAINNEMNWLLSDSFVVRYSTHTPISKFFQNFHKNPISSYCHLADYKFICGTNIFKYNLFHLCPDFNINLSDIKNYKSCIAVGCGVAPEGCRLNGYTKYIYKRILSKEYIHSVRDEATKIFLEGLGFRAINTGCPTMWGLTKEHCSKIPLKKSKDVVFTLTDYKRDSENDKKLIEILVKNYENVYFWIQGSNDYEYLSTLCDLKKINIINPNLDSYEKFLDNHDVDFVGTRLHAGICAMQHFKRTIIISVDNRADDIKKTHNIVTVQREDIVNKLGDMINSEFPTDINIDLENIETWKAQFEV